MVDPVWLDPEFMLGGEEHQASRLHRVRVLRRGCGGRRQGRSLDARDVSLTADTATLEKAADAAKYGELSAEPHVEFFIPSQRWPGLAPDGKHVIAARVQYAPYHLKGGWNAARTAALRDKATAAIARLVPGFERAILHRAVLTPRDVEERFGVTEGALTHGEMTLDQILFMRPVPGWGHYGMPIDGSSSAARVRIPGRGSLAARGISPRAQLCGRSEDESYHRAVGSEAVKRCVGAWLLRILPLVGRRLEPVACRPRTPHDRAMKSRAHPTYKTQDRLGNSRV